MKFGMNGAGFPTDDFADACAVLASAGYDGVEPNYAADGPIATEEGRRAMRRAAESNGLSIPAVSTTLHWEYPLSSPNEGTRRRGLAIGEGMIDAAAALGADEVLIVPAVVEPSASYGRCYERALDAVRDLARYGDDRGVGIAVENVQNDFLYSPGELARFVERAGEAGPVSVYFDVGNGLRWGLPDRWIRELGARISRVHVKDWLTDAHRPTYPLQGDVDWPSVVDALAEIGYDGWITAEVPPYRSSPRRMPAQVIENLRYLFEGSYPNEDHTP
ncbi:sugar phosphate isomerase/epimerase family protein [Halomarina halobia]|uniref:Sugar phosphate isomerase/epimerase family protein n=1 Tax=Halomarina halobia TaxID=3033386 RepID=A0ABD6AFA4_9EURY|nr:sugar phosphate isomerase/epimerase family protein [Halomarina sp. PSR21]